MKITIIAVGNLKEQFLKECSMEYQKRISKFSRMEIIEIPEENFQKRLLKKIF